MSVNLDILFYYRYVDDIRVCTALPPSEIDVLLERFNAFHPLLQFTVNIMLSLVIFILKPWLLFLWLPDPSSSSLVLAFSSISLSLSGGLFLSSTSLISSSSSCDISWWTYSYSLFDFGFETNEMIYITFLIINNVIATMLLHHSFMQSLHVGMRIRIACNSFLYQKVIMRII